MSLETLNARRARAGALAAIWGAAAAPAASHARQAIEPDAEPVTVSEASMDMMLDGPQDLPGHEPGPRERTEPTAPAPPAPDEPPDWFGGKPWWEWSSASGTWGGQRSSLEDAGLSFAGSFYFDYQGAWSGGLSRRAVYDQLLDLNATLDLDKAFAIPGATVFIDYMSTAGDSPSRFMGDFHGTSNLESERSLDQIAELWWQQWLFDRRLRVKFGKVDANREFGAVEPAGEFANSGAALDTANPFIPWYPDPATGVNAFIYPSENWYIGAGFYDGSLQSGVRTGARGPGTFFSPRRSNEYYTIAETGYTFDSLWFTTATRIAGGGWYHGADFGRFDGGTESGTFGLYALLESTLWKRDPADDDDTRGLACFARYGHGDGDVNDVEHNVSGGMRLEGTFEGRDADSAGAFVSWSDLSDVRGAGYARDETVVDVYYRISITPFLHVQPELQFVIDPGGSADTADAVVASIRVSIEF